MSAEEAMAERLARRIDHMWGRFEETGEDRFMRAAMEADRLYRRVRASGVAA